MTEIKLVRYECLRIFYCTKLHLSDCYDLVATMKESMNFNIQPPSMFVRNFWLFTTKYQIETCLFFRDISIHNISWSHVDCCKFCFHLRSLNVRHVVMIKDTDLLYRGHLQWHDLLIELHKHLTDWFRSYKGGGR
jgi:hypothetical protein